MESRVAHVRAEVERLCRTLGPGALLPGERELAEKCAVSRSTVRLALADLTSRRVVERRHGAGTYARRTAPAHPLDVVSFHDDMARRGLRPDTRVLRSDEIPADEELAAGLAVEPGDPVVRIARLRLADDEPMAREVLHVPAAVAPGLRGSDLDGGASWYELLELRYGRRVAEGTQTVEPVLALDDDAALLEVPSGSPAWRFVRTSRDETGDVVERVDALVRADRYLVELPITRPRGRGY
ncbi:GntR family transcriptional regulator [Actinomycetospora sp. NBRC 106378]|uniref:GntR family transcriptional regulator n=1 Tax=Actinomycetospora sp. NBRC 106378 TaxID=3032208 RepID=UPI0024A54D38|nr:GntR family transcriptional regulator [Actinomycetospora sp. NBRC 106378]GLZ53199.1 GntR family transcriptional regulator [Actinomycetospora sp. NBRC 106378]